ncbi:MAG: GntR family transcriptional regulator [Mycobacteriaceae bacterium]|uniref:GntR family transcriptional regulator n=1 Tax=Corynebacterium sp. TaxID=1720 RepID=UPI003F9D2CFA
MPPPPNGPSTKNDYAYAQLHSMILTGELEPGSRLDQSQLSRDLGLSTTPLREAIRRLTSEGLVQLSAHRDARVSAVSAEQATHLLEVRETLDPLAAGLAADRRTDEDLERIGRAEEGLRPLGTPADPDSLRHALESHRTFHRAIYTASRNPVLIDELERLWDKADRYRIIGLKSRRDAGDDTRRVAAEHRGITAAIESGDAALASDAMRLHIRGSLGCRAIDALHD